MPKPIDADLTGKVAVVTGANSGIGKATTAGLAALGATVVLACRSQVRGQAAVDEIQAEQPDARLILALLDLSDLASVHACADHLLDTQPALHILVNNGAIWLPERQENAAGVELTWATNVLGPFALTQRLIPRLVTSAPARIVNVSSVMARGLDLDDVGYVRRSYGGMAAYGQSKQANRMWTWALAQRLTGTGVTANALHPGGVGTSLGRHHTGLMGWGFQFWGRWLARSPAAGADTVIWLAASPDAEGETGRYWMDRRSLSRTHIQPDAIARLWDTCATQTAR